MTRKERLQRTLRGDPVDRPPVNFYELNGYHQDPEDMDEFNIFNDPSWQPLLTLVKNKSDRIILHGLHFIEPENEREHTVSTINARGSLLTVIELDTPKGKLTRRTRRDRNINTVWETEHLLKTKDDILAYLSIPETDDMGKFDPSGILKCDEAIGDEGLAAFDIGDALCSVAPLFSMEDFTVFAMTEQDLFTELLNRAQKKIINRLRIISEAFPGRLYRICGSEYASVPYLPPLLHRKYVVDYEQTQVDIIHKYNGYARIHSHGNLSDIIDGIISMGVDALDPVEPPPQGDVFLRDIRERYGKQIVIFGNIEVSEIENLDADAFRDRVKRLLEDGMSGTGRGFVLMPTSCPYGRKLSDKAFRNYEIMVELTEDAFY